MTIEVDRIIDPIPASDGAGVKLKRSIGVEPNYFDPFLMLDEFGSENSEDYIILTFCHYYGLIRQALI